MKTPIRLAYAITTHKVRGVTLTSGLIDHGKSEKNLGTTFVQLSRFKKLNQFLIRLFSFEEKIAKSTLLVPNKEAETQLQNKFTYTLNNYKHNYKLK